MKLTEIGDTLTVDDSDTNTKAGQKDLGKTINQKLTCPGVSHMRQS
jgi:hypothetical protein